MNSMKSFQPILSTLMSQKVMPTIYYIRLGEKFPNEDLNPITIDKSTKLFKRENEVYKKMTPDFKEVTE